MKRVYRKTVAALCFGCIQSICTLGSAWLLTAVVNIVTGANSEMTLPMFSAVAAVFYCFYMFIYWLSQRFYICTKADLRAYQKTQLFSGLLWVSDGEQHKRQPGDMSAKFQQQIDTWESDFLEPLYAIIKDAALLLFSFCVVAHRNWLIAIGTVGLFSVYLVLTKGISKKCEYLLNVSIGATVDESNELVTMVKGFYLGREHHAEDYFTSRYVNTAEKAAMASYRCNMMYNILSMLNGNLGTILTLMIMVVGGVMLRNHAAGVTVGAILGYSQLVTTLIGPIGTMGTNFAKIRGSKSLRADFRLFKESGEKEKENWTECGEEIQELEKIILRHVSFAYGEKKILNDVSLSLMAGKKYAIIGQSGSGKTTLLKLILHQIEPSDGALYWNDVPYSEANKKSFLRRIGYVAQDPIIFHKSIKDNIVAGNTFKSEKDSKKMCDVLRRSGMEFLRENDSINERISIPAQELSGGEKKRLAYARALYKDCDVLVLDEVLSSVHNEMAQELESDFLHSDKRLIIHVTHNLSQEAAAEYDGVFLVENENVVSVS